MTEAAVPSDGNPYTPPHADTPPTGDAAPPHDSQGDLHSASFIALLFAAGLGALNDNIIRWIVVGIGKRIAGKDHESLVASLGMALFVAPFLLFAAPAGFLADRFSKRSVIINIKLAELLIMLMGALAVYLQQAWLLFVVLFLMGSHSALFGPVKYGTLPEILRYDRLSAGNGVLGLVTYVAIIFGGLIGNVLAGLHETDPQAGTLAIAGTLVGVAGLGWLASFYMHRLQAANPSRTFPYNIFNQTYRDISRLATNKALFTVALGITFFWSLGAMSNLTIDDFGLNLLHLERTWIGILLVALGLGIGFGSAAAGFLSGGRIELGLVPIGAAGLLISALMIWAGSGSTYAFGWSCFWLAMLGASGGLFEVPLSTYLQHKSPPAHRGAILAASNFLTFSGTLVFSGLFWILNGPMKLDASVIFLFTAIITLPVMIIAAWKLPYALLRMLIGFVLRFIYRIKVYGLENIPTEGGALFVSNHVSWADSTILQVICPRPVRMIAFAPNLTFFPVKQLSEITKTIPLDSQKSPKAILRALQTAREAVQAGDIVCIFAEGQLTRTGQMLPFQRGFTRIVEKTTVPIVPVYLDGLWGSIFSFRGGKFFWKWPRTWPYPISVHFGKPITGPTDVHQVRQTVMHLGVEAVENRRQSQMLLPRQFLRQCRKSMSREKVVDSFGTSLTGGKLLAGTIAFARILRAKVLAPDEQMVGVLLPPSVGGALANSALTLLKKVSVNLNYTASERVLNACIKQCQMKHILTSRKVFDKLNLKLDAELVFVEDLKGQITKFDQFIAGVQAFATPVAILERMYGLTSIKPDDPMTIVFTSGSTGDPKGVVLTHLNIAANVDAMDQLVNLKPTDGLLGILPFFHSFGFTITLWTALALEPRAVYHYTPLDGRQVGQLCQKHKCTILMATPTFLRTYLKRTEVEQFESLDMVIVGAEKLPAELAKAFEEKFKKHVYEGYGLTELSPLVSVNVPDFRSGFVQKGTKDGTVGRPIPNMAVKVVDPETFEPLPANAPGMLLVRGPNLMQGYLNRPDLTSEKIKAGWYITGDIAFLDDEGFITITGRLSRFSKIGGEMVPHILIEEAIQKFIGGEDEVRIAVTAVPDEKKGERIIVIHTKLEHAPKEICHALSAAGLPNLWIPGQDSFFEVEQIPVLGSGKVALSDVKELALKKVQEEANVA